VQAKAARKMLEP